MASIIPVPAFNDNYLWILHNKHKQALVVDPGDALPVLEALKKFDLELTDILLTHHHADHIGGVNTLVQAYPNVNVFGPDTERFTMVTKPCSDGQFIKPTAATEAFQVLSLPGHTIDHIGYYAAPNLFVGDTLFSAGCGRLFEGTPKQMFDSLLKLTSLPDDTHVYCAHEYTDANCTFARHVLPNLQALNDYHQEVKVKRNHGESTIPTQIGLEKQINPFLMSHNKELKERVAKHYKKSSLPNDEDTFALLREWKDNF